jgi:predicted DNA-binding transcriptional regulator AlpA
MDTKLSYSVTEFCELNSLSKTKFYDLLKKGQAPVCMRVGERLFISCEAAAAWRRQMEIAPTRAPNVLSVSA